MSKILNEYKEKCGSFHISEELALDDNHKTTYIYSDRFIAETLYSKEKQYAYFSDDLQELYKETFANPSVMTLYAAGIAKAPEEFEKIVNDQSLRALYHYPFSAFIVYEKEFHKPIGYQVIGNSVKTNAGEIAGLLSKDFQNSSTKKHCGFENAGALVWGYGNSLFKKKVFVNKIFNDKEKKFEGGQPFTTIYATARLNNIGSYRILQNLGFRENKISNIHGNNRYEYELGFNDPNGFCTVDYYGVI